MMCFHRGNRRGRRRCSHSLVATFQLFHFKNLHTYGTTLKMKKESVAVDKPLKKSVSISVSSHILYIFSTKKPTKRSKVY